MSHTPPFSTMVDRLYYDKHVGSRSLRYCIEDNQPQFCICGHIHQTKGMDRIGRTSIYNPGMLLRGGWLEIIIEHSEIQTILYDRI